MFRRFRLFKRYPELKSLAQEAQRGGATHARYTGPAIGFYRIRQGQVECCFAEYSSSTQRYEWIWQPPDWREQDYLPGDAVSISKFT